MKLFLKLLFITSLSVFARTISFSQIVSKEVSITASGSGKTIEDAKQAALRSAIEQTFGAFISSKTEMFNDQVVADQMASVSSGNIKTFSILNESQFPDGSWGVTIKALVSVDKLASFVVAKGIAIEINGGMFALNIKQQSLNELGEVKAVGEMVGLLHEPMQISFDYVIKSSDPKSLDTENKNWEIPLEVTATTNKNMDFCASYCIKTLSALSLSADEVYSYKNLNKAVFPVNIIYDGVFKTFYLRTQRSIDALTTLLLNWEFYTRLFTVQSGMNVSHGNGESRLHKFYGVRNYENGGETINFLTTGQKAASFSWVEKKSIQQIEQMTGYNIKPRGVISHFKHGGFVVYEIPSAFRIGIQLDAINKNVVVHTTAGGIADKAGIANGDKIISINNIEVVSGNISELVNKFGKENKLCEITVERKRKILSFKVYPALMSGYGLVASITDLGVMNWNAARIACDELVLTGYSDWYLPTKEELNMIFVNLNKIGVGGFESQFYWSSSEIDINNAFFQSFNNGNQYNHDGRGNTISYTKILKYGVRAVRSF